MTRIAPVLLFALLPFIASAQKITVEFDEARDFSGYKTFIIRDGALHSKNPSLNNVLVKKKIEAEIRKRLIEKGMEEVESRPDLNVRYSLGSGRRTEVDRYPSGWGGTRVVALHYTEGTLILDLRDAKQHELVWRAIAIEDKSDPMKIKDKLEDMVKKSLEKYPPKKNVK